MGLGFLITKAIAGRGVAERSERRQLEKKYSQSAKDLKSTTEVSPEQLNSESAASSYRSTTSYLEPLNPRLPPQGTLRCPRPPLERSHSELCVGVSKSSAAYTAAGPAHLTAKEYSDNQIRRNYSLNNVLDKEKHVCSMPPLPEMRGFGKYRMAVDADEDHQMNHLHRTMSDLTDQMVHQLGDFSFAGVNKGVWREYQKFRTESMASSTSSLSSANLLSPQEGMDSKRGCIVTRGFTPSIISSASSSFGDDGSSHYRKDSTLSMTSTSSDGDSRHRRRKSRQASLPISDNSTTSPLTTITENPDAFDKPQRKIERPCEFDSNGHNDSALASDASDDEWVPELEAGGQISNLSKQIDRNKKTSNDAQTQLTRPRTQSGDQPKPRPLPKPTVDRSRTAKHSVRPSVRRAHSHRRTKTKPIAIDIPRGDNNPEPSEKSAVQNERVQQMSTPSPPSQAPATSAGSEEAKENPSDLRQYMEMARSKHSSRSQRNKNRESEDDGASVNSSSTTRTLMPVAQKIANAFSIQRRQRSVTAVRIPTDRCQPSMKAEGSRAEASQETAQ